MPYPFLVPAPYKGKEWFGVIRRALLPMLFALAGTALATLGFVRGSADSSAAPLHVAGASIDLLVPDAEGMSPLRIQMLVEVPAGEREDDVVAGAIEETIASIPGAVPAARAGGVSAQFKAAGWVWEPGRMVWSYNDSGRPQDLTTNEVYEALLAATRTWNAAGAAFQFTGGYPTIAVPSLCGGLSNADQANTLGWWPAIGANVLARTCTVPANGPIASESDIQFDSSRNWTLDPEAVAIDFHSVSLHELGHVLGLGHSSTRNAVMYGSYSAGQLKRELETDDLAGIYDLYGAASPVPSSTATASPTPSPTSSPTPTTPPLPLAQTPLFVPGLSTN